MPSSQDTSTMRLPGVMLVGHAEMLTVTTLKVDAFPKVSGDPLDVQRMNREPPLALLPRPRNHSQGELIHARFPCSDPCAAHLHPGAGRRRPATGTSPKVYACSRLRIAPRAGPAAALATEALAGSETRQPRETAALSGPRPDPALGLRVIGLHTCRSA